MTTLYQKAAEKYIPIGIFLYAESDMSAGNLLTPVHGALVDGSIRVHEKHHVLAAGSKTVGPLELISDADLKSISMGTDSSPAFNL